jgi:UDP-glucose 4-epimerase
MKKCIVIGGGGFIGRNLIETLSIEGYKIKAVDKYTDKIKSLEFLYPNLEIINLSVEDTDSLVFHLGDIENIIWLVHTSVPSTSMSNLEIDLTSNLVPLLRFLQRLLNINTVEKFIYLSSGGTIYGEPLIKMPICESHDKSPISNYGLSKLFAENYINFILGRSDIQSFILRPSNIYGLYQNLNIPQGIIGHALIAAKEGKPIILFNNKMFVRDFLFVSDLVNAINKCLDYNSGVEKPHSITFNVGFGRGYTIQELLDEIRIVVNIDFVINNSHARYFDCTYNVLNTNKIKTMLGWETNVNLNTGIKKVWDWLN